MTPTETETWRALSEFAARPTPETAAAAERAFYADRDVACDPRFPAYCASLTPAAFDVLFRRQP